jgi:hypothetical protein
MGYFLAPFSTKSDFGSFFLAAVVSLAIIDDSPWTVVRAVGVEASAGV